MQAEREFILLYLVVEAGDDFFTIFGKLYTQIFINIFLVFRSWMILCKPISISHVSTVNRTRNVRQSPLIVRLPALPDVIFIPALPDVIFIPALPDVIFIPALPNGSFISIFSLQLGNVFRKTGIAIPFVIDFVKFLFEIFIPAECALII